MCMKDVGVLLKIARYRSFLACDAKNKKNKTSGIFFDIPFVLTSWTVFYQHWIHWRPILNQSVKWFGMCFLDSHLWKDHYIVTPGWCCSGPVREIQPLYDIIIHQTHYEKSDWSRAFNQFTIACELDMINVLSAADITFIMSS